MYDNKHQNYIPVFSWAFVIHLGHNLYSMLDFKEI